MSVEIHTSKGASWSDGSEASFVSSIKVKAEISMIIAVGGA
jgi:hypothetical protein